MDNLDGRGINKKKVIIASILVIVIAAIAYLIFFYTKTCSTKECFDESLKNCNKAEFLNLGNMTLKYTIKGMASGKCEINVVFLRGEISNQDYLKLKDKEMNCYLVKGLVISPESSLDNCHGELKEELQGLIINKLHKYIVQNLGKLNADLFKWG